jgi:hypothetical protein
MKTSFWEDNENAEAHWGRAAVPLTVSNTWRIRSRMSASPPATGCSSSPCFPIRIISPRAYTRPTDTAAGLYEEQGAAIADIQKTILAVSRQEEPYDIFICYKETNGGSARTRDSVKAQEIYYALTIRATACSSRGYRWKTSWARNTSPISSPRSTPPRLCWWSAPARSISTAVWVKNEWSRFLSLAKRDRARLLIPCYQDMSPYDLPEELSYLQAQDMGRIGVFAGFAPRH